MPGKQQGEQQKPTQICQEQIRVNETHSFNDQVTGLVDRREAEELMYLYSSKVFDTVSVGILISKLGKTQPTEWAQN